LQLPERFTLRFDKEETAQEAMKWIRQRIRNLPALKARRIERDIEVEHIPCRKGMAVRVLSERLGIARDEILAIGDAKTDRCMLDRRVAFYTGCPMNADDEAKQAVHTLGGHISREFTMAGVIDIIKATLDGNVSSEIPPEPEDMPRRHRTHVAHSQSRRRDRKQLRRSMVLGAAIVGITLVVFASFGTIPGSGLIMKPIHLLFRLIDWLFSLFS
jgi:hypothetical protein